MLTRSLADGVRWFLDDERGDVERIAWTVVGLGVIGFVLTKVFPPLKQKIDDFLNLIRNYNPAGT